MVANILLLGRNGNGKSSTGNSILGKRVFTPRSSSQQEVEEIKKGSTDDNEINVVEGPGIGDTNMNSPEEVELVLQFAEKALRFCEKGFHAVVCVLKYGIRFTSQEKDTVSLIRDIFGETVFSDHGIIVMTYGDSFALDMEEEKITFEDWCEKQTGSVKDLFKECGHRIVLFNNRAKDEGTLKSQRDKVLNHINKLQVKNGPYTLNKYKRAEIGHQRIRLRSKLPDLEKDNNRRLSKIRESINQINVDGKPEEAIRQLNELANDLDVRKKYIQDISDGTGLLQNLLTGIGVTEQGLKTKLMRAEMLKRSRSQDNVDPIIPPEYDSRSTSLMNVRHDKPKDEGMIRYLFGWGQKNPPMMPLALLIIICILPWLLVYGFIKWLILMVIEACKVL